MEKSVLLYGFCLRSFLFLTNERLGKWKNNNIIISLSLYIYFLNNNNNIKDEMCNSFLLLKILNDTLCQMVHPIGNVMSFSDISQGNVVLFYHM